MQREAPYFKYSQHTLHCENVSLVDIAKEYDTPCYVYAENAIRDNFNAFKAAFGPVRHRICYAVKANSNLAILNVLAKLGAGFDIVSAGELSRVLAAQGDPDKIVFSGVGKTKTEIMTALKKNIFCFDIESVAELARIATLAQQQNTIAKVALRINPNIDAKTHPYIATGLEENKFGIDLSEVIHLCEQIQKTPSLQLIGLACHIGSQLTTLEPFIATADCLLALIKQLQSKNITLQSVNLGGGLGVQYQNEKTIAIPTYIKLLTEKFAHLNIEIMIEPGRAIVANAGVLLTRIEYIKETAHKKFAIVDAGMNDLLRPALYDAWQEILPVQQQTVTAQSYDIVGPVCETADFLGKQRQIACHAGDLLAIMTAGAYGFSMSSNYNSRPRAAEILVTDKTVKLIRERESIEDLFSKEKL